MKFQGATKVTTQEFPYNRLTGEVAEAVFRKYHEVIQEKYGEFPFLDIFSLKRDEQRGLQVLSGSSSTALVILNNDVFPNLGLEGLTAGQVLKTVHPSHHNSILQQDAFSIEDRYIDLQAVFNPHGVKETLVSRKLREQLLERKILNGSEDDHSLSIPYTELTLDVFNLKDELQGLSTGNRLLYRLKDNCKVIPAPTFSPKNNGKTFDILDENGHPIFKERGKHTYYANDIYVFARLCLDENLDLNSGGGDLPCSGERGQVEVSVGEANTQKI